jgi:hypothetical protein
MGWLTPFWFVPLSVYLGVCLQYFANPEIHDWCRVSILCLFVRSITQNLCEVSSSTTVSPSIVSGLLILLIISIYYHSRAIWQMSHVLKVMDDSYWTWDMMIWTEVWPYLPTPHLSCYVQVFPAQYASYDRFRKSIALALPFKCRWDALVQPVQHNIHFRERPPE